MNIASQLVYRSRQLRQAPALTDEFGTTTFGLLAARIAALAGGMASKLGVSRGDRVLICCENRREYVETLFAAWTAGACVVPVNAKLHGREIASIAADSECRAIFGHQKLLESVKLDAGFTSTFVAVDGPDYTALLAAAPLPVADVTPETLAWIFYTSGTTGFPKGAMLSHRNLMAMAMTYYADIERVEPGATMLHTAALSHGGGLYLLPHLLAGGHQVISRRFEPTEVLDGFARYPAVSMFAVPTMVNRLVQLATATGSGPGNLSSLVYGGAPMYVADLELALSVFGPRLYQLFAQGEAPMTITGLDRRAHAHALETGDIRRLATCGSPRTGVEVRVVDANENDCPLGELGEVIARSDCVMGGYWRNPAATASALRNGWLHTGDIGYLDETGDLTLRDRAKDMLISGGSNVYPREIEEVLLRHPGVLECSVIGRPHHDLGEEPVAFVVGRAGEKVSAELLDSWCLDHIARFKRPREYRFVDALPKSSYDKILKTELRRLL